MHRREQEDKLIQFLNSSEAEPRGGLMENEIRSEAEKSCAAQFHIGEHSNELTEEVDSSYNSGRSSVETSVVEDVVDMGVGGGEGRVFQLATGEERLLRDEVTFLNQESTRLLARAR